MRGTVEERFWAKVDKNGPIPEHRPELGPCHLWTGKKGKGGYGAFSISETEQPKAHVFAYELESGPVPDGLTVDHLCSTPPCVRRSHLEAVTQRENNMRSSRTGTESHCPNDHEFTPENTYIAPKGYRQCRTCKTDAMRRFKAKQKESA